PDRCPVRRTRVGCPGRTAPWPWFVLPGGRSPPLPARQHQDRGAPPGVRSPRGRTAGPSQQSFSVLRTGRDPWEFLSCDFWSDGSTKVEMAEVSFVNIDVTHRQMAMIVAVRFEEFKIPRVIRHGHFVAKLRRAGRRCVQHFGKRAFETKQRAPTRYANIDD